MESSVGSELIWTEPDTHKAKETYQANVSSAAWGLHDCSFLNRNKMPLFCNLRSLKNPDELRDFLSAVVGFPGGSSGKEHACQCRKHKRHRFNPWVGKIPWRRAWQPNPVFLPGESHGQSLVDYSPYSHRESDMTEYTHMHTSAVCQVSIR